MIVKYISLTEYAAKIGRNVAGVRRKCEAGSIPGAVKIGRNWAIPEDAPYTDNRVKSGRYKNWRKPR